MSFLAPAFLAGLALLAVPILVHLTQRQRSEVHGFPSLMFLRRVPFRASSRRRIRHPLLFALRCAAIALLALAFARPALPGGAEAAEGAAARDRVILLDVSGSLGHGDRWDRAVAAAGEALDGLAEGDRAALVTFDDRAEERVALTEDLSAVRRALETASAGDRATRFDPGIQLAGRMLAESDRRDREVLLISDFQRSGWEEGGRARLPDGVGLVPVDLAGPSATNRAVTELSFHARRDGRLDVAARIANLGEEPAPELAVSLELGGRVVATRSAALGPRAAATVTFERVPVPDGRTRGEVRIAPDALPLDDVRRFLVEPGEGVDVLLLESSGGRDDASLFLERALSIGEAPPIRVSRRRGAGLERSWLAGTDVVVWNDAGVPSAARIGLLREWVAGGGGLFVTLGPRSDPASGPPALAELLGGRAGGVEDRAGRGGSRLAWLDYDHPALELFAAPRSGDFSRARFFRFRAFEPARGTAVLARFEDGEPALLERTEGEGRVLVWASTLDRFWNDLALQPVYLPFAHRLVRHAAGWREPRRWWTVGRVVELETALEAGDAAAAVGAEGAGGGAGDEWVLVSPGGDRRAVERSGGSTWLELDRAGFWELRPAGAAEAAVALAVNAPLEESDLAAVAPERVVAAATGVVDGEPATAGGAPPGGPEDGAVDGGAAGVGAAGGEDGRELWWPLLLAAGLVLAVESVLANRWARRRGFRPASRAA